MISVDRLRNDGDFCFSEYERRAAFIFKIGASSSDVPNEHSWPEFCNNQNDELPLVVYDFMYGSLRKSLYRILSQLEDCKVEESCRLSFEYQLREIQGLIDLMSIKNEK